MRKRVFNLSVFLFLLRSLSPLPAFAGSAKLMTPTKPEMVRGKDEEIKYSMTDWGKDIKIIAEGPVLLAIQIRAVLEGKVAEKVTVVLAAERDSAFRSENKITLPIDNSVTLVGKIGVLLTETEPRLFEVPEGQHTYIFRLSSDQATRGLFKLEIWKKKIQRYAANPETPVPGAVAVPVLPPITPLKPPAKEKEEKREAAVLPVIEPLIPLKLKPAKEDAPALPPIEPLVVKEQPREGEPLAMKEKEKPAEEPAAAVAAKKKKPAPEEEEETGVMAGVGLKFGFIIPAVNLPVAMIPSLELRYILPFLERALSITAELGWYRFKTEGMQTAMGAVFSYSTKIDVMPAYFGLCWRIPPITGPLEIYWSAGMSLLTTWTGGSSDLGEMPVRFDRSPGYFLGASVAYPISPGKLTSELRFSDARLGFRMGEANGSFGNMGGTSLNAGYRIEF